ncbi:MAG: helix-turn-helix domain-containing protein [Rubripirellula sp.]
MMTEKQILEPREKPSNLRQMQAAALPSLSEATQQFQIDHIELTIKAAGGNMTLAAQILGLHRSNLYRKMRQLGMSSSVI